MAGGLDHGGGAQAVDRDDVGARHGGGAHGALDLERDVVDLKVEEDLEAALAHGLDDRRALGIEERHADLDPGGLAGEHVGELEGALATAVERDDDLVGGLLVRQHSAAPIKSLMSETPCSAAQAPRPSTIFAAAVGS